MITREQVLAKMPGPDGKLTQKYPVVINAKIIKTLHQYSPDAIAMTKDAAPLFLGKTTMETCKNIWDFLKANITYSKDGINQNIKLPNRFIYDGVGDCKSYALFTHGVMYNLGIPSGYRYSSYTTNPIPQHVYTVAQDGSKTNGKKNIIICDAVWHYFNQQKPATYFKDFMPINVLSGVPEDEMGSIFSKAKDAVKQVGSKVQDKIKDTGVVKKASQIQDKAKNTGVVKTAAKAQQDAKDAAKKAGQQVVTVAKKGAEVLKKVPNAAKMVLGAPARRAFRTLVAVNFHSYATKLNADLNGSKETWKKLGGIPDELVQSINAGLKRKAILGIGCLDTKIGVRSNGVGEPVTAATIATIITLATPVIIALAAILKESAANIKAAREKAEAEAKKAQGEGGGGQTSPPQGSGDGAVNQDGGGGSPYTGWPPPQGGTNATGDSGTYYDPNYDGGAYMPDSGGEQKQTQQGPDAPKKEGGSNTGLLLGGLLLAKLLLF